MVFCENSISFKNNGQLKFEKFNPQPSSRYSSYFSIQKAFTHPLQIRPTQEKIPQQNAPFFSVGNDKERK